MNTSQQKKCAFSSDLARIDLKSDDPFDLFKDWLQEAKTFSTGLPSSFCLATVSKELNVSARHLVLREYSSEGFVFMTDDRSRKVDDLKNVPSAAMCFLWSYYNDTQQHVARQVRVEGAVQTLPREKFQHLYDREPFYCKIRSHICHQDQETDWDDLKKRHDELVEEARNGNKSLPMPDYVGAYVLIPSMMEFYHARDCLIADRLKFSKADKAWTHKRICA
ncbi:uncharacterized protein LOC105700927 isoform X2 [Orussus abietinus]|uniref:uncharacterized protein LOC105700927 isoform X2 n=1 Tax=Orussus abietinus TaxID=222816 RepID=UPI000626477B|nr:uncharacterized protein LOC105700927 isoform X2 [Orussus abietinus]